MMKSHVAGGSKVSARVDTASRQAITGNDPRLLHAVDGKKVPGRIVDQRRCCVIIARTGRALAKVDWDHRFDPIAPLYRQISATLTRSEIAAPEPVSSNPATGLEKKGASRP
jgi:hypothetical protein